VGRWLFHAGGIGASAIIGSRLLSAVAATRPQLIWVNQGEFLGPGIVRKLRAFDVPVVNYVNDNPFSGRDGLRFYNYQKALPYYDLAVVTFAENVEQATASGARRVTRAWLTADEEGHTSAVTSDAHRERYKSDVAFVGTWMPERGPFMVELLRRDVPLSIWGDGWQKAPEWPQLAANWRGGGLYDQDYVAAITSAKVCLGLLSKGNRNLHTSRSVEIPALGGLFCAERTSEHLALYEDGREAVFWDNAAECAAQCQRLLADEPLRRDIAHRGHERALRNNLFNEPLMAAILQRAIS
jgi:spore maturation protein CgeB